MYVEGQEIDIKLVNEATNLCLLICGRSYECYPGKISPNATTEEYLTGSARHPSSFSKKVRCWWIDCDQYESFWGTVQSKRDCDKNDAGAWKYVGGILKNLFLLVRSGPVLVKLFVERLWQVKSQICNFSLEKIPVRSERGSRWMSVYAVMLALDF